jgi:hypothetical protein
VVGVDLGRDGFPDGLQFRPRPRRLPPGIERRPEAGAFLAAGHAEADEAQALGLELALAADGVESRGRCRRR